MNNKRRFTRFTLVMKAILTACGNQYDVEKIENLSIGGCFIPVPVALKSGANCNLRIPLTEDEGPVIDVEGTIIRSDENGVAINFTRIDPDSLLHLQRIARYNSPDPDQIEQEIKEHPGIV